MNRPLLPFLAFVASTAIGFLSAVTADSAAFRTWSLVVVGIGVVGAVSSALDIRRRRREGRRTLQSPARKDEQPRD